MTLHVALYQPEIPPNTGNVIRLCANTGCRLHLIRPLGFDLSDAKLRRAGLDYHEWADMQVHDDLSSCLATVAPGRVFAFTTKADQCYTQARVSDGDLLLFGPETRGLPAEILQALGPDSTLRLPMLPTSRSLNLSNAVAVAVFEAWRQLGFPGGS